MTGSVLRHLAFHSIRISLPVLAVIVFGVVSCFPPSAHANAVYYSNQVGSYTHLPNALEEITRLQEAGRNAFYRHDEVAGKGKFYRVYVGKHDDMEGAELEGRVLRALGLVSAFWIRAISEDEVDDSPNPSQARSDRLPAGRSGSTDPPRSDEYPTVQEVEEKLSSPPKSAIYKAVVAKEEAKPDEPPRKERSQFEFRGQLSAWSIEGRDRGSWSNNSGLRYIPQLSIERGLGSSGFLDAEVSANAFVAYESSYQDRDPELELYRLKLRYATTQTETRIGLQKINFGPAFLLRPLRWFDQLDPRDPLQLTDGVYGLRFKYDTMSNASFWFWALYDNDRLKGYEVFPTTKDKPELGWRLQYPVLGGEVGVTLHTRQADAIVLNVREFRENRYALDGRWDVGIGLWFESVFQQQRIPKYPYEWQKMITLGMDYTLGFGSGLHILGEHMVTAVSAKPFQWDEDFHVSAFSLSYSIGFFDSVSAIGYYTWDSREYYQYVGWQRTYDSFIIQLGGFHYPDSSGSDSGVSQSALGAGYGGQLMVIYNH